MTNALRPCGAWPCFAASCMLAAAAAMTFPGVPARADVEHAAEATTASRDGSVSGVDVRAGFAGVSKTASWIPLQIALPPGQASRRARVWAPDPEGQAVGSPWLPLESGADGRQTATLHARLGRPDGRLDLELDPPLAAVGRLPIEIPPPLPASASVVLVIGDLPAASRSARLLEEDDGWRPTVVEVAAQDLPASGPLDFDAADVVVLCGRVCPLPEGLYEAIDAWVRRGGRLVFLAGECLESLANAEARELAWLPAAFQRLVPLRSTAAIETFARASRPLAVDRMQLPLLDAVPAGEGSVLAAVGPTLGDLPLAVRSPRGFGTVAWIALDLDSPPLDTWPGSDSLLLELLGRDSGSGGRAGETSRDLLDLTGQLKRAVDRFDGVQPVPFELIGLLAVAFVASLYPLCWSLAMPPTGRGGWLALAASVIGFTLVAFGIGSRWKVAQWRQSRAGMIDIDLDRGSRRGFSLEGLWSPDNTAFSLRAMPAAIAEDPADAEVAISWAASSGRSFGGPDTLVPHASLAAADYAYEANLATLGDIPLAIATSGVWQAEWAAEPAGKRDAEPAGKRDAEPAGKRDAEPAGVRPSLPLAGRFEQTAEGTLRGSLENRLPFDLEGCVLAYAGWLYDVGTIRSGEDFDPSAGRGPRSLAGAVSRRTVVGDRDQVVRYDRNEADPLRILEVASFHDAIGGRSYTALEAGRLARYDLSDLLRSGRAVLVGRGPAATDWQADVSLEQADPPRTLWRFVIPVGRVFGEKGVSP